MQIYLPGTMIGQYEIASNPMIGGMGVVYFCIDHANDGRPVALKTFKPEYLPDRAARDRFLREGTVWVELGRHPHIVRCYEVKYIDPTAFLVLELIAKEQDRDDASLRAWLGQPMPVEQALLFALQIARGMKYATEKIPGFAHRDLKPENVLVGADKLPGTNVNRLRVTDFGLAAILKNEIGRMKDEDGSESIGRTHLTRGIVGTPLYMAPEQWKGEPVGVYTDIYALGCILYEMLTGKRAAEGKTISELQAAHCAGKLRPLPADLPRELRDILIRSLSLRPAQRCQSWDEVTGALEQAYEARGQGSVPDEGIMEAESLDERRQAGWSYAALGMGYLDIAKVETAIGYFKRVQTIGQAEGDHRIEVAGVGNLGNAYYALGDIRQAVGYYEQALKIAREIDDHLIQAANLGNLGAAYEKQGDIQRAIESHEQALVIARRLGDRHIEINALNNIGNCHLDFGNAQEALEYYDQYHAIAREIHDQRSEGKALNNRANVYLRMGDTGQAFELYEQALTILNEIGDLNSEGAVLISLGNTYSGLGNVQQAIICYERALSIAREIGNVVSEASALNNIGSAYDDLGDTEQSIEYYKKALLIAQKVGSKSIEEAAIGLLGCAYTTLGDFQCAIKFLERQLEIARKIGDRYGEGKALNNLGIVYKKLGNTQQAIECYEHRLEIARESDDHQGVGKTLGNLGGVYAELGDIDRALKLYEQRIDIANETGDINGKATAMFNMAGLFVQQDAPERALALAQDAERIWEKIGNPNAQHAQRLVTKLKGNMSTTTQTNPIQITFDAFQRADSPQTMQAAVAQYPILKDRQFIEAIEEIIKEQVPPESKSVFEQRLAWLKQIAGK